MRATRRTPVRVGLLLALLLGLGPGDVLAQKLLVPDKDATVSRTDRFGDPLPPHALARLGSLRWQIKESWLSAVTADGKKILNVDGQGEATWLDAANGKELRREELLPDVKRRATKVREEFIFDGLLHLSQDGKQFAGLDIFGDLHLWESDSGKRLRKLSTGLFYATLGFAPDGKHLAIYGASQEHQSMVLLRVDLTSGDVQRRLLEKVNLERKNQIPIAGSVALRDDGQVVLVKYRPLDEQASKFQGNVFRTELTGDKEPTRIMEAPVGMPVILTSNGERALMNSTTTVKVVDTANGKELHSLAIAAPKIMVSLDYRQLIGLAGDNEYLAIWDIESGKMMREFGKLPKNSLHSRMMPRVVSRDNKTLVCQSRQRLVLIDLLTGKVLQEGVGHDARITDLSFTADGKQLLTQAQDMTARLWDVKTGKEVIPPIKPAAQQSFFLLSPDLKTLVTAEVNGALTFLDQQTEKVRHSIEGKPKNKGEQFNSSPATLAISPDSRILGELDDAGKLRLFDLATAKVLHTLNVPKVKDDGSQTSAIPSQAIVFSPRAELVAAVVTAEKVLVWNTATGKLQHSIPIEDDADVRQVAIAPDLKSLALDYHDGRVILWDLSTAKRQASLGTKTEAAPTLPGFGPRRMPAVYFPTTAFSPDGRLLARAGKDAQVHLWNVADRKEIATFAGHAEAVVSVTFSPDGTRLASSSLDNTVLIWDVGARLK